MTKRQKLFLGVGLFAFGVAGWYIHKQYKMAQLLCFKPKKYRIRNVSMDSATLEMDMEIKNMGELAVKVRNYKFRIYGNKRYLATAHSEKEVLIKPYSSVTVPVTITLNPRLLFRNVGTILTSMNGWRSVELTFDGGLKVTKGVLPLYIPVRTSFKLSEFSEPNKEESTC
jgi:LEA14-like dessication related protein